MAVQKGGEGEALELTVDCSLGSVFVCLEWWCEGDLCAVDIRVVSDVKAAVVLMKQ